MYQVPSKRKAENMDATGDGPADHRAKRPAIHNLAFRSTDLITNDREDTEPTTRHQRFARADVSWRPGADRFIRERTISATETDSSLEGKAGKNSELGVKQVRKVEAKGDPKEMDSAHESSIPEARHVLQTCEGCNRVPKTCICYAKAFPTEEDIANGAPRGSFIDLKRVPQFQGQFRDYSSGVTQYIQPFIELNLLAALDREQPVAHGRSRVDMYYERLSRHEGDLDRIFS
ncbi:hypothetical protein BDV97DRAFT_361237, partial [Delphinella strobiligena]